jgi:hypothetical protein
LDLEAAAKISAESGSVLAFFAGSA